MRGGGMGMPIESAEKRRETNKALAERWLEDVAANLSDEESTKALTELVCWIVLVGGQITLLDLIKELTRRL